MMDIKVSFPRGKFTEEEIHEAAAAISILGWTMIGDMNRSCSDSTPPTASSAMFFTWNKQTPPQYPYFIAYEILDA